MTMLFMLVFLRLQVKLHFPHGPCTCLQMAMLLSLMPEIFSVESRGKNMIDRALCNMCKLQLANAAYCFSKVATSAALKMPRDVAPV